MVERTSAAGSRRAMHVMRHVRELIDTGRLVRGQRLPPERELARQLHISRASLRAGLGYLAAMGVLNVRHGGGTFISSGPPALGTASFAWMSSLHGFTDAQVFEARLLLEGSVAALAAERAGEHDFAAMRNELSEMRSTLDDPETYLIHDVRFHQLIAAASGNPILCAMMEPLGASVYDTRMATVNTAHDLPKATEMHQGIYEALLQRNAPAARQLMEQHLRRAELEISSERESRDSAPTQESASQPGTRA